MSLFKVRNWWKTQCPTVEPSYDSFSLHCARLCLEEGEKDSIVIGCHSGQLCIYQPSGARTELPDLDAETEGHPANQRLQGDALENQFQPSDVLLEVMLPLPVIGVSSGKFTTSASRNDPRQQLAVLHPMRLCIFQIVTVEGIAEHGDYTKLVPLYDHALAKPAFSFCQGPFGGIKGREFLCVQHLDSSLRFFEQDGISYERTLATDRHLPSPVRYVVRTDCFVTVAPSWVLECYRYQDIAEAQEALRRHDPIWSLCVGEYALDLSVHQISSTESVIVVLGENNLLCVSDTGKVRFIKKLDYSPICFHAFVVGWYWEPGARLLLAVVSESGSLLIYENDKILWSAQLPDIPVALSRANVSGLPGALVTLGQTGSLTIGYLGSEPELFKVPALNLAPLELDRCQRELLALEREIRAGVDPSDASIANAAAERDVTLELSIDNCIPCTHPTNITTSTGAATLEMCRLSVTVHVSLNLEMLQLTVALDPAIRCTKESFLFRDVLANSTELFEVWLYPYEAATPASLAVTVSCSYTNKQSITRVLQRLVALPLQLFVKSCPASKEAKHKITLTASSNAVAAAGGTGLNALFPEFCTSEGSQTALGLQSLVDGRRVTIVAAKNTNRFRIQSDELTLLPLVFECLLKRFNPEPAKTPKGRPGITVNNVPPVSELANHFRIHHDLRRELKHLETELEIATSQMRLFERRFVVKLQDRSLRALDGVLLLLKRNHSHVAKLCQMLKTMRQAVKLSQIHLGAVLQLFSLCYCHSALGTSGGVKYLEYLRGLLSSTVIDSTEQSYEQMLLPVARFLEQTGPLRNVLDGTEGSEPTFDEPYLLETETVDETTRAAQHHKLFEKYLHRVLERVNGNLATASKAIVGNSSGSGRNSVDFEDQPLPEAPNEDGDEEETERSEQEGTQSDHGAPDGAASPIVHTKDTRHH
ncbi:protein PTHB1-like [Anopheles darlingi]|uniref:protein PTHB1-like n=1 Tax=Anopheles darlingi TaxID=43151 RepID=UPI0021001889|nr:protein PTHB1-like [Anopheles darlingi]